MGWRENVARWARDEADGDPDTADALASDIPRVLFGMLDADRIALARELLAGTGVPRAPKIPDIPSHITPAQWDVFFAGWYAANAAMLGDEG